MSIWDITFTRIGGGKASSSPRCRRLLIGGGQRRVFRLCLRVAEDNVASKTIISSFDKFVRINGDDDFQEWPEQKGGGRKKLLVFEWRL